MLCPYQIKADAATCININVWHFSSAPGNDIPLELGKDDCCLFLQQEHH